MTAGDMLLVSVHFGICLHNIDFIIHIDYHIICYCLLNAQRFFSNGSPHSTKSK